MPLYRSLIYPPAKRGYPYIVVSLQGDKVVSAETARTQLDAEALRKEAMRINSARRRLDARFPSRQGES